MNRAVIHPVYHFCSPDMFIELLPAYIKFDNANFELQMASIPKFGSFRPKAKTNPSETVSQKLGHERNDEGGADSFYRRRGKPDQRHSLDKHGRQRTDTAENQLNQHPSHYSSPTPRSHHDGSYEPIRTKKIIDETEESDLYIIDRRGDAQNIQYGSLHKYSIPQYRRIGHGRLVGTPTHVKLNHKQSTEKLAVLISAEDDVHYYASRPLTTFSLSRNEISHHLLSEDIGLNDVETQDDFVPFQSDFNQERVSQPPEPPEPVDAGYRSQMPAPIYRRNNGAEAISDDNRDLLSDDADLLRRKEQARLSQYTKDHPLDVDGWLRLIEHQKKGSSQWGGTISSKEKLAIADIIFSIYDQALAHVDAEKPGYDRLVLSMLKEGSVSWDAAKLRRRWAQALKSSPNSTLLWTKYVDFIQTDNKEFHFEACKSAYVQCLRVLQAARKSIHCESERTSCIQIYIFLRLTSFMRDAGYDELAIGCWQALLEYHFFHPGYPNNLDSQLDDSQLDSLENFWDAEVPRIGERHALGWQQFIQNKGAQPSRQSQSATSPTVRTEELFHSFACEEIKQISKLHLPAPSDDGSMSEDPFQFIMFSDIRSIVETLRHKLPVRPLINAFLTFMHLPAVAWDSSGSELEDSTTDQFIQHLSGLDRLGMNFANVRQTTYNLFDQAFTGFQVYFGEDIDNAYAFVSKVLEMLVLSLPDNHELSEYILAFGLTHHPSEAPKAARRSLKAHPSSLRLYNAYALIEARLGRLQKAEEVWQTALSMRHEFSETTKDESILLWHSRIMTHILKGDETAALRYIFEIINNDWRPQTQNPLDEIHSPAQKLRVIRHLEEGWNHLKHRNKPRLVVLYAECHMWCEYLTSGCKLEPAIDLVQQRYLRSIEGSETSLIAELLHQAESLLIKLHFQRHRAYRPARVSKLLHHPWFDAISNAFLGSSSSSGWPQRLPEQQCIAGGARAH